MFGILCVWRACSKILPTRENLQRRKVKVKARCELCCQQGNNLRQHAISVVMPICKKRLGHGHTRHIFLSVA